MEEKTSVAFLFGGGGAEHAVSEKSAAYLLSVLDRDLFAPLPVGIDRTGRWFLYTGTVPRIADGTWRTDLCRLTETFPVRLGGKSGFLTPDGVRSVAVAVPVLHGDGGEDGTVQGTLTAAGIPYVGCDAVASAIGIDKFAAKAVAAALGIPTLPAVLLSDDPAEAAKQAAAFGFPLFLKPLRLGSSVGCAAVSSEEDFPAALAAASRVGGKLLAEPCLSHPREIECAYFADGDVLIPPPGEVLPDGVYTYRQKYGARGAKTEEVASLPAEVADAIRSHTRALAEAIGVRQIARFDYFLTERGVYFNEVNTFPGMTGNSLYPRMLAAAGISPTEMLSRLIGGAR